MKRLILCAMVWLMFAATSLAQGIQTSSASLICDPNTCAAINARLPGRFGDAVHVADPSRFLSQPLAALQLRSSQ